MELLYGLSVEAEIEVIPAGTLKPGDIIKVEGGKVTVETPDTEDEE